jgi:hypothetical protein
MRLLFFSILVSILYYKRQREARSSYISKRKCGHFFLFIITIFSVYYYYLLTGPFLFFFLGTRPGSIFAETGSEFDL